MSRGMRVLTPMRLSLLAALVVAGHAAANPTGANVVRGSASTTTSGNLVEITNSPNSIINWQSFSIGQGETTRFIQQTPSSAVLNRVTGSSPSQITGSLSSNGKVFLLNANGVLFAPGAQVATAGFTASTGQIADNSFTSGATAPSGGATIFVGGPLVATGTIDLGASNISVGGISAPGANISISANSGTINVSGTISNLSENGAPPILRISTLGSGVTYAGTPTIEAIAGINGDPAINSGPNVTLGLGRYPGLPIPVTVTGTTNFTGTNISVTTSSTGAPAPQVVVGPTPGASSLGSGANAIAGGTSSTKPSSGSTLTATLSMTREVATPPGAPSAPAPVARVVLEKREPLY
jgi:filamentous hemagglutinin family protein